MFKLLYLSVCVSIFNFSFSAKILFYTYGQTLSHKNSMYPLAQALFQRGHKVLLHQLAITKLRPIGNVPEKISIVKTAPRLAWEMLVYKNLSGMGEMIWKETLNGLDLIHPLWASMAQSFCYPFLTDQKEEFLQLANQEWDLIFVDSLFASCSWITAAIANKPYIIFHTGVFEHTTAMQRGLPLLTHTVPNQYSQCEWSIDSFWHRFDGFIDYFRYIRLAQLIDKIVCDIAGKVLAEFSVPNFLQKADAVFFDNPQTFDWSKPLAHDVISSDYQCHRDLEPIATDVLNFLDTPNSEGTILVSFGSIADWKTVPQELFKQFLKLFHQLKQYQFLFTYQGTYSNFPRNVFAKPWLESEEKILQHPMVKLLISHGGTKSFKKAVCSETPILFVPLYGDQYRNALMGKTWGFAEILQKTNLTAVQMVQIVLSILSNDSYKAAVNRARTLWLDHIVEPLDEGAFWSEYIVRHGGMPKLFRSKAGQMSWFHYWCVDVILLLLLACVITVVAFVMIILILLELVANKDE